MPTAEQAEYDIARQQIDKFSEAARDMCRRIKQLGPRPPAGAFARWPGGMGSTHLGGALCDWDTHNPGKGGNSWALCRKSHVHYGSQYEPAQGAILTALENSVQGDVACVGCCCVSSLPLTQVAS